MRIVTACAALCVALALAGCADSWQANRSSQAVDIGLGDDPWIKPANGAGYVDGSAMDMRSRH